MKFSEWYGSDLTGQTYDGSLECENVGLTSLEGCPEVVTRYFNCSGNELTSLEHGPKVVGFAYYCYNNRLKSLDGLCYSHYIVTDVSNKEVQEYLMKHFPEMMV